jgi:hypothetical protein
MDGVGMMSSSGKLKFGLAVALGAASLAAYAGPVKATIKFTVAPQVGKVSKGQILISIPNGYHVYANPPSIEYQIPLNLTLSGTALKSWEVKYPVGKDLMVSGDDKQSKVYEGTFSVPFTAILTKPGKSSLKIKVEYQMCDEHACLPPSVANIAVNVVVKKK